MTDGPGLLIGEFARRCRLPVSTLRYYDRIGLLAPTFVDTASGYRRYDVDQVPAAELISRLRGLGIAPQHIATILAGGIHAAAALQAERARIAAVLEQGRRHLTELDALLGATVPEQHLVEVVEVVGRQVAVRAFAAPFDDLEAGVVRAIGALRSTLRRGRRPRLGPWGASFPLDLADEVAGFVFAPLSGADDGSLETVALPAGRAVTTLHRGGPATLSLAYRSVFAELDRTGETASARVIEEYLALDADQADAGIRVIVPIGA